MAAKILRRGSIWQFVIIAVILVALLALGGYLAQQRGAQVRQDQAIAQAEKNKPTAPSTTPAASGDPEAPATQTTPAPAATAPEVAGTTPATSPSAESTQALPQTGPADNMLVSLLALGSLTAVSVAYVNSRRQLAPAVRSLT